MTDKSVSKSFDEIVSFAPAFKDIRRKWAFMLFVRTYLFCAHRATKNGTGPLFNYMRYTFVYIYLFKLENIR